MNFLCFRMTESNIDEQLLIVSEYESNLHVLTINGSSCLSELYANIGGKWGGVNPMSSKLKYTVPGHRLDVTLNNDEDVKNMWEIHLKLKVTICNLKVVHENDSYSSRKSRYEHII